MPTLIHRAPVIPKASPQNVSPSQSLALSITNSDDSEGLVKTLKSGPKSRLILSRDAQMSGALAPEDVHGITRLMPPRGRERAALLRVVREADYAKALDALEMGTDEPRAEKAQAPGLGPFPVQIAPEETARTALKQYVIEDQIRTIERARPVPISSRKPLATPSTRSSILALANFKHRTRQPSILQIGREDEVVSKCDIDDLLDDFQPDDESTPLVMTRLHPQSKGTPGCIATTIIPSSQQPSSSRSRKRKLTPPYVQILRSQSSPIQPNSSSSQYLPLDPYTTIEATPEEPEPTLLPNETIACHSQEISSDIMAAPQSSSPAQSPTKSKQPPNATNVKATMKRQQPSYKYETNRSVTSTFTKAKKQPLVPISTANLQNLLPRRRNRQVHDADGGFDIPESSDAELDSEIAGDEDELSFVAPVRRKGGIMPVGRREAKPTSTEPGRKVFAKSRVKMKARGKFKDAGSVKTYSHHLSDKENVFVIEEDRVGNGGSRTLYRIGDEDMAGDQDEHVGMKVGALSAKAKRELITLTKKFKEVDEWQMEFEEVTASSSSPRDAR